MSRDDEPIRLSEESSGASSALRDALRAAKADMPKPAHVEHMLARFPFPPPGGGGSGGPGALGGGSALAAKWIGALTLAGAVGTGGYLAVRASTTPPDPPPASSVEIDGSAIATTAATIQPTLREPVETTAVPEPSTAATSASAPSVGPPHTRPSAAPARPEMDILKEAQAAVKSNPGRALELVNEHAASYPKSSMAQEREMLRIQALLAQGKRQEARALADAFKKAHPNSAYAQRLDSMF